MPAGAGEFLEQGGRADLHFGLHEVKAHRAAATEDDVGDRNRHTLVIGPPYLVGRLDRVDDGGVEELVAVVAAAGHFFSGGQRVDKLGPFADVLAALRQAPEERGGDEHLVPNRRVDVLL